MSVRGIRATLVAVAAFGVTANIAPAAPRARTAIEPALGDWEGAGPHGLGLSFEFVRRGRQIAVRDLALGLPSGCLSAGNPAWETSATPGVEFITPGTVLRGPFRRLGSAQFQIILPPKRGDPSRVVMPGRLSSARRGALSIPSPSVRCTSGAWPRILRFRIAAAHRVSVTDGLWTGNASRGPGAASSMVQIRVIDGGRIETDFKASFTCPDGQAAGFEIGPLPTIGNLISADGGIGGIISGQMVWSGQFTADGHLTGTFMAVGCASAATYTFSATRTGS